MTVADAVRAVAGRAVHRLVGLLRVGHFRLDAHGAWRDFPYRRKFTISGKCAAAKWPIPRRQNVSARLGDFFLNYFFLSQPHSTSALNVEEIALFVKR